MPGKDATHGLDLEESIKRMLAERLRKETDDAMMKSLGMPSNKFILPESIELDRIRDIEQRKFKDSIMQDWQQLKERDPNEEFRRETKEDIAEIKDAIRKIGIMFGDDAPSREMMKKHKMLKDAYNKYKMIEALVLDDGV